MIKLLSYILITLLFISSSIKGVKALEFFLLKDYISQKLCIEKDIEDSCCKGKCFINGKKEQKDSNEKKGIPQNSQRNIEVEKTDKIESYIICSVYNSSLLEYFIFNIKYSFYLIKDIFHPPQVLFLKI